MPALLVSWIMPKFMSTMSRQEPQWTHGGVSPRYVDYYFSVLHVLCIVSSILPLLCTVFPLYYFSYALSLLSTVVFSFDTVMIDRSDAGCDRDYGRVVKAAWVLLYW